MMPDQPSIPEPAQPQPRRDPPVWVWVGGWIGIALCICVAGVAGAIAYFRSVPLASFPLSTPQIAPASPPTGWKSAMKDTFTTNDNNWPEGKKTYTEGDIERTLENTAYRLDVNDKKAEEWYTFPVSDLQPVDQYVSVDARLISAFQDGMTYGLLVRFANPDNFYQVTLSDDGYWEIESQITGQWNTLVRWTRTRDLNTGQVNHLAVLVQGNRIMVFLNGRYQGDTSDDQVPRGKAGLVVSSEASQHIVVDFDNFEIQTP